MFDKLYHTTSIRLAKDSIIEKGLSPLDMERGVPFNWGKASYKNSFIEILLEVVRLEQFPSKPKRNNSIFTCNNIETLNNFKKKYRDHLGCYCYEVTPVKESYNYHIGDYNFHNLPLIDQEWEKMKYKDFHNYAVLYWSKPPPKETTEIIIDSPIKIVKEIELN